MGKIGWIVLVILVLVIVVGFLYYKKQQSGSAIELAKVQAQQQSAENKLKLAYYNSAEKGNIDDGLDTLKSLGLWGFNI